MPCRRSKSFHFLRFTPKTFSTRARFERHWNQCVDFTPPLASPPPQLFRKFKSTKLGIGSLCGSPSLKVPSSANTRKSFVTPCSRLVFRFVDEPFDLSGSYDVRHPA